MNSRPSHQDPHKPMKQGNLSTSWTTSNQHPIMKSIALAFLIVSSVTSQGTPSCPAGGLNSDTGNIDPSYTVCGSQCINTQAIATAVICRDAICQFDSEQADNETQQLIDGEVWSPELLVSQACFTAENLCSEGLFCDATQVCQNATCTTSAAPTSPPSVIMVAPRDPPSSATATSVITLVALLSPMTVLFL